MQRVLGNIASFFNGCNTCQNVRQSAELRVSTNISACRLHSSIDRSTVGRSLILIDSVHTSLASVKPASAFKNIYGDMEADPTQYVTFEKKSVDVWTANHSPADST